MKLKHTKDRVVVSVDMDAKNSHRFADGTTIRIERGWENFNLREVSPTNATVISADYIPEGAEVIVHHNSVHEVNRIYNYVNVSKDAEQLRYYSIPEVECFAWRDGQGELQPMKGFAFGLRVYEPYLGVLEGIPHKIIKDVLYITTGELTGKVVHTLKAADYEMVFQNFKTGREDHIIRCRHYENEFNDREEIVAISNQLTNRLQNGELLIGLSPQNAKPLEICQLK